MTRFFLLPLILIATAAAAQPVTVPPAGLLSQTIVITTPDNGICPLSFSSFPPYCVAVWGPIPAASPRAAPAPKMTPIPRKRPRIRAVVTPSGNFQFQDIPNHRYDFDERLFR